MADGRIIIDSKIDTNGIDEGLKDINRKLGKVNKKPIDELKESFVGATKGLTMFGIPLNELGSSFESGELGAAALAGMIGGLTAAFVDLAIKGVQMAISALKDFAKQGIETASNIQESANVINVVFGDDTVSEWANEVAGSFNLAEEEATRFASTFGAVMTPTGLGIDTIEDMSITLSQLSGDLASLWNTDTEQAFNALRAGLTGESEPLKQFGVVMLESSLNAYALSQGINKTTQEMTEAEKAVLRYNFILENTKVAQGDAQRSSDSFANTQKQLELTVGNTAKMFGDELLPSLTAVTNTFVDFIKDNQAFVTLIGNIVGAVISGIEFLFNDFLKVIDPVIKAIDFVSRVLNGLFDTIELVAKGFKDYFGIMSNNAETSAEDMGYYMQEFSGVSTDAMESTANATEKAFKSASDSIKDELGVVSDALKKYYDDDLKEYEKSLRERMGGSKNAEKEIFRLVELRRQANENAYNNDMKLEEKKTNIRLDNIKKENDAIKNQTKVFEEESKKQKSFFDNLGDIWDKAFKGFSFGGNSANSSNISYNSRVMESRGNSMAYATNTSSVNTSSNAVYNMNLYGSDFEQAMKQAQRMNRYRG